MLLYADNNVYCNDLMLEIVYKFYGDYLFLVGESVIILFSFDSNQSWKSEWKNFSFWLLASDLENEAFAISFWLFQQVYDFQLLIFQMKNSSWFL